MDDITFHTLCIGFEPNKLDCVILGDVLDRMFWQLSLEEERENQELLEIMEGLEERSRERSFTNHWVTSILKVVVDRSINIVEYKNRKKEKKVEAENVIESILEGVVNRGFRIFQYREKMKKKTLCTQAAQGKTTNYPSVRKWLITKEESNETAGMSNTAGAKCGKLPTGERLKLGSNLHINLGIKKKSFSTNSNLKKCSSTQTKAKSNARGTKRKTEDLEFSCKPGDMKRSKVGPMDRHTFKKAKLGLNPKMTPNQKVKKLVKVDNDN